MTGYSVLETGGNKLSKESCSRAEKGKFANVCFTWGYLPEPEVLLLVSSVVNRMLCCIC